MKAGRGLVTKLNQSSEKIDHKWDSMIIHMGIRSERSFQMNYNSRRKKKPSGKGYLLVWQGKTSVMWYVKSVSRQHRSSLETAMGGARIARGRGKVHAGQGRISKRSGGKWGRGRWGFLILSDYLPTRCTYRGEKSQADFSRTNQSCGWRH